MPRRDFAEDLLLSKMLASLLKKSAALAACAALPGPPALLVAREHWLKMSDGLTDLKLAFNCNQLSTAHRIAMNFDPIPEYVWINTSCGW